MPARGRIRATLLFREAAMYLGIDAGGTHTDAAVIHEGRVLATAKVPTDHERLPASLAAALAALPPSLKLDRVRRVTLGATLAVNALVQGRGDAVGMALSAGPGMAPLRFSMGDYTHVTPGGLDHRGVETTPLDMRSLREAAAQWREQGIRAFAAVGKFSPRNPAHERAMADVLAPLGHVTQGCRLSGLLNFPRRIAGAWFNSAVWRLHNTFVDAVEEALRHAGITAPVRLLKADGGAAMLSASRNRPLESILSGPAAGVMGVMALCPLEGDSLLLDMGGTTTDLALFADAMPVLDRNGMRLPDGRGAERGTHVRALATRSLGTGGDSRIRVERDGVAVGPFRDGPAMAFGGTRPTLLDALNTLGTEGEAGNAARSREGVAELARRCGMPPPTLAAEAARKAVEYVVEGARALLNHVNERPVYTLAALLRDRPVRPERAWLVGGPAPLVRRLLEEALGIPVRVPTGADAANAVGAALAMPAAELELFADTTRGVARAPALDWERTIDRRYTLEQAKEEARQLLRARVEAQTGEAAPRVDVLEAELFATLDQRGHGGRDIRVRCRTAPGIAESARF